MLFPKACAWYVAGVDVDEVKLRRPAHTLASCFTHLWRQSRWTAAGSSSRSWWGCAAQPVKAGRQDWRPVYRHTALLLLATPHPWLEEDHMYMQVSVRKGWFSLCLRVEELRNSGTLLALMSASNATHPCKCLWMIFRFILLSADVSDMWWQTSVIFVYFSSGPCTRQLFTMPQKIRNSAISEASSLCQHAVYL